ncbi:hypothetical protein SOVF_036790 isoform B [Spinacia oleracea]|uniref:Uncharacterized protein isoform X2 n=1 Tax=Spinacia oleracea TaxID=3562 RepID=A0ABM3RDX5_SPIOL|nr:uncharacterized protein LOC110776967 isoform X2 [Spinacia oleracea]KNA22157.1 hypothetical protein SOVF_036790 isoform B [Spinacia oleracea]
MTSITMGSTSKKRKNSKTNDGRDRLSELPDEVLVHILSFLPILDAVQTVSVRRFGDLWTLLPCLNFKDTEFIKVFLVKLKLTNCGIKQLSGFQMRSLRKLSLSHVELKDEVLKKIISGCPSLQELALEYVRGLEELRFSAPSIEKLDLTFVVFFLLDCPNLKILNINIRQNRHNSRLEIVDVSSVREVNISAYTIIDEIDKLLKTFHNVEVFKFSDVAFQPAYFQEQDFPQTRWKRLHIKSRLSEDRFLSVCTILRSSPQLEELIIYTDSRSDNSWDLGRRVTRVCSVLSLEFSPCVMLQLKTVTISGHKLPSQGLLRLAEFLLKNSVNMENMGKKLHSIISILISAFASVMVVGHTLLTTVCIRSSEIIHEVDKLLKRFCNVEVIELDGKGFQLSKFQEQDFSQTRWKRLRIESQLKRDHLLSVCTVLRSSPHLEELIIYNNSRKDLGVTNDCNFLSSELSSPCLMPQLKTVTFRGHKVPCQGLLRLAEFLLKSCVKMERMAIFPRMSQLVAVEEIKFLKQLLSFPRASTNARVIFGSEVY